MWSPRLGSAGDMVDGNRDLSLHTIIRTLQPGVGQWYVGERVDGAVVWPQVCVLYQGAQLIELAAVLAGEHEVVARVLAPGLQQVLWLRDVDDRYDAAELREGRGAAREGVAADGVE